MNRRWRLAWMKRDERWGDLLRPNRNRAGRARVVTGQRSTDLPDTWMKLPEYDHAIFVRLCVALVVARRSGDNVDARKRASVRSRYPNAKSTRSISRRHPRDDRPVEGPRWRVVATGEECKRQKCGQCFNHVMPLCAV